MSGRKIKQEKKTEDFAIYLSASLLRYHLSKDSEGAEEGSQVNIYGKRVVDRKELSDAKTLVGKGAWQL